MLGKLGIPERAVAECEERLLNLPEIDYDSVHQKLGAERDKSNHFITSVIEKAKK